jgi:hypothetical protein
MNFVYLIVPGCNNCSYEDGLILLKNSVNSLLKYLPESKIYIYYGYDESSKNKLEEIEKYLTNNSKLIGINIGELKHNFPRIEHDHVANSIKNPYRLNILIEKIYILLNHNSLEEIIFTDLDTEFNENILNYQFCLDKPILYSNENKLLNQRSLESFFSMINYNVHPQSRMFNSGIIYIPLKKRKLIAQEALDLVLLMNKFSDKLRLAKDLDEQIAISVIIYKYYKENILFLNNCLTHYMGRHIL